MKKIALPLIFIVATGIAACSSNKPSVASANQKEGICKSASITERLTSDSAGQTAAKAILNETFSKLPQDIQDNIKPFFQDVSEGKTSGSQYNDDLAKAKKYCGSDWNTNVSSLGK